jgi:hypothetical protein
MNDASSARLAFRKLKYLKNARDADVGGDAREQEEPAAPSRRVLDRDTGDVVDGDREEQDEDVDGMNAM